MKDENSVPTAQKMTDVSLSIFRSKFKKTRIQMIDYSRTGVFWMFSPSGSTIGRISSVGMGPSDLLSPKDLAIDREGNAIIADASGAVKVFSPRGQLLISIPFQRPEHVATLSDGRILVSGFPKEYLISIFDRQGRFLANLARVYRARLI